MKHGECLRVISIRLTGTICFTTGVFTTKMISYYLRQGKYFSDPQNYRNVKQNQTLFGFIRNLPEIFLTAATRASDYSIFIVDNNIMKSSKEYVEFLGTMIEMGFISVINEYRRCKQTTQSTLDNIFIETKHKTENISSIIIQTKLSDHYTISAQIVFDENKTSNAKSNKHQKVNKKKLKAYL